MDRLSAPGTIGSFTGESESAHAEGWSRAIADARTASGEDRDNPWSQDDTVQRLPSPSREDGTTATPTPSGLRSTLGFGACVVGDTALGTLGGLVAGGAAGAAVGLAYGLVGGAIIGTAVLPGGGTVGFGGVGAAGGALDRRSRRGLVRQCDRRCVGSA